LDAEQKLDINQENVAGRRESEAGFAVITRGEEAEEPCVRCEENKGPFKKCIFLDDTTLWRGGK